MKSRLERKLAKINPHVAVPSTRDLDKAARKKGRRDGGDPAAHRDEVNGLGWKPRWPF
ncbi:hypothetical protein [Streptomyces sp. NPDC005302]|uniref:hypothetical protein n=1 Tax=Streptomyces sp. NPDC005302 TaxID=3154675 RepID=UPI0033A31DA7